MRIMMKEILIRACDLLFGTVLDNDDFSAGQILVIHTSQDLRKSLEVKKGGTDRVLR